MTTTTKPSAAFKTWTKRLDSLENGTPWSHSHINAFRLAYVVAYGGRAGKTTLTFEEAEKLVARFEDGSHRPITDQHATKGLNYLKSQAAKLRREGFPIDEVLEGYYRFTWSGYVFHDGPYISSGNFDAQLRIHLADGGEIVYSMAPWQSGGINTLEWRRVR